MLTFEPTVELRYWRELRSRYEELLEREEFDEICFRFTDLDGRWVQLHKPKATLGISELIHGFHFSCRLPSWRAAHQSDYLIKPDHSTFFLEAGPNGNRQGVFICDVWEPTGLGPYRRDPRLILKKAMSRLTATIPGARALVGPELEFYILKNAKFGTATERAFLELETAEIYDRQPDDSSPCFRRTSLSGHLTPEFDSGADLRKEIVRRLTEAGLSVIRHHHELGPGQNEISIAHSDALRAADTAQIYKHIVRATAVNMGRLATFMPMPFAGTSGSGAHFHMSLYRDKENLFANGEWPSQLSELARFAIGGILKHVRALNCFLNPSVNSYRRLFHSFGAGDVVGYGHLNRHTIIRIPPATSPDGVRIEVRFGDGTANPYLAIASLIMAMLDGIEKRLDPGPPTQEKRADKSNNLTSARETGLAFDLRGAGQALDQDRQFLKEGGVFFDTLIDSHLIRLSNRVHETMKYPHPVEFSQSFAN